MNKTVKKNVVKALLRADDRVVKAINELVFARNTIDQAVRVLELKDAPST